MLISGSGGGSSKNDLRTSTSEESLVKQRKRKQPDSDVSVTTELNLFRNEIMSFFKEFGKTQKADISDIKQNLGEIKAEFQTLKTEISNLSQQCGNLQAEVSIIQTENKEFREKFGELEANMHSLKIKDNFITAATAAAAGAGEPSTTGAPLPLIYSTPNASHEALIFELEERQRRSNNIIVVGISEITEKNLKLRQEYDLLEIMKILKNIYEDCPCPVKTMRLGKYTYGIDRPIRVSFESTDTIKLILRNKFKLTGEVRVYADQTPSQRSYLKSVKDELLRRERDGESDLIIKYVKGLPRIVKRPSKNSAE